MEQPLTRGMNRDGEAMTLKEYERIGGYGALRKALNGISPLEIRELVTQSNLRGRGGAGFPTGIKWKFMPDRKSVV